jgi:glycosyltransferase involved in cell wall biosynthesis
MDVFVFSTNYEGFGLVLLEAAHACIPIIASSVSAVPEVLGSNYSGLFESKNSKQLCSLMVKAKDSEYRDFLKSQLKPHISKFDPEIMADKIENLYLLTSYRNLRK